MIPQGIRADMSGLKIILLQIFSFILNTKLHDFLYLNKIALKINKITPKVVKRILPAKKRKEKKFPHCFQHG